MSGQDDGPSEYLVMARSLRARYDALRIPEFAQSCGTPAVMQGATWWQVSSRIGPAANDDHGDRAEHFAREGVRLRASTFKLRLSECIWDDGRTH